MLSRTYAALLDIRENIGLARQIVGDMSFDSFENNRILFYAATRALEIISEATRRLPPDLCDRHPHLPWRDIKDAGNFYRHQYDNVAEKLIWRTIRESLTPLLVVIEAELAALPHQPS